MALLGFHAPSEPPVRLGGEGIYLRYPELSDYEAWAGVREHSRAHLEPWEPLWPEDDLTRRAFRRRIDRYARDRREERGYSFVIMRAGDDALLGACTLSLVRRGVAQACALGYWIGAAYAGRGHMTAAVARLAEHVFTDLRLHRLEAACVPANIASRRVLERCGFTEEGLARGYLKINGRWQDHVLFALLADDPRPVRPARDPRRS